MTDEQVGPETWQQWLKDADSARALAPDTYDADEEMQTALKLRTEMTLAFADCEVRVASPELYQDGTGMTHCRLAMKGTGKALCWIILSRFGKLATVAGCSDPGLLARILDALKAQGFNYIAREYLASESYDGACRELLGLSWENRYFALAVDYNDSFDPDQPPSDG